MYPDYLALRISLCLCEFDEGGDWHHWKIFRFHEKCVEQERMFPSIEHVDVFIKDTEYRLFICNSH